MIFLKPWSFLPYSLEICLNLAQTSNSWSGTIYTLHLLSARSYNLLFLFPHAPSIQPAPCNLISVDFVPKFIHLCIWWVQLQQRNPIIKPEPSLFSSATPQYSQLSHPPISSKLPRRCSHCLTQGHQPTPCPFWSCFFTPMSHKEISIEKLNEGNTKRTFSTSLCTLVALCQSHALQPRAMSW